MRVGHCQALITKSSTLKGRGFFLRGDKLNLPEVTVSGERNEGTKEN